MEPCYFAYGSNMSTRRLRARIAGARPLGRAHLDDWRLSFDKPGLDGTAKANLVRTPGAIVWGVLFEIDASDWDVLDRYEPGYRRESFRLTRREGGPIEIGTYVFPEPASPAARLAPPSDAYLAHVLDGALEHDLPAAHIEYIRSFAVREE